MPTDATGPTTSLGIPTFATSADAPSGLGFNNTMQVIDGLLKNLGIAGLVANDVPVYDSVAGKFKKASGTPSASTFLRGDGAWSTPNGPIVSSASSSAAQILITATSQATSQTILTLPSFTADGVSKYLLEFTDGMFTPTQREFVALYNGSTAVSTFIDNEAGAFLHTMSGRYLWTPPAGTFSPVVKAWLTVAGTNTHNYDSIAGAVVATVTRVG